MSALTKWNPFRGSGELENFGPLARWNPFQEMKRLQRELDRVFNGWRSLAPNGEEPMTITEWSPAVDIVEDEKEFVVKAELPEVNKGDLKVTVERDILTIRGERKSEKEEKGKKFHRIERSYGSFLRSFSLPEETEAGKIHSEYKEGLLTVHLPKSPEAKAKSKAIEVKVE
jgi:HSP20 family protein